MATAQQLSRQLNKLRGSRIVLVGIGNILRSDDAAGSLVCRRLKERSISADIIDAGTAPENYIQRIIKKAPQNLLVVDAIDFQAPPGTIKIFSPKQLNSSVISTHTLSPRLFVDMVSQSIKVDVYFIGIQPAQTQLCQPVSDEVCLAVELLSKILTEIFSIENNS